MGVVSCIEVVKMANPVRIARPKMRVQRAEREERLKQRSAWSITRKKTALRSPERFFVKMRWLTPEAGCHLISCFVPEEQSTFMPWRRLMSLPGWNPEAWSTTQLITK